MEIKEFTLPSTDRIHTLYGKIYVPDGEARGTVQMVHGITEHIDRYEVFMTAVRAGSRRTTRWWKNTATINTVPLNSPFALCMT